MENPDCLISKILGLFKIQIEKSSNSIYFMITENMIGNDKQKVIRSFDLKGSTFSRHVKITKE